MPNTAPFYRVRYLPFLHTLSSVYSSFLPVQGMGEEGERMKRTEVVEGVHPWPICCLRHLLQIGLTNGLFLPPKMVGKYKSWSFALDPPSVNHTSSEGLGSCTATSCPLKHHHSSFTNIQQVRLGELGRHRHYGCVTKYHRSHCEIPLVFP